MLNPRAEHIISPPKFGCGFCGQPPSACQCNKHDQPQKSHQPHTLSFVFADFANAVRFQMLGIRPQTDQLANKNGPITDAEAQSEQSMGQSGPSVR